MNERLIKMLKRHEGFIGKPYFCSAGRKTIGYGRNLDDVGLSREESIMLGLNRNFYTNPITEKEAEILLINDIKKAEEYCKKLDIHFETLDEVRKDVVINMMFNLGFGRLSKFKKTLSLIKFSEFQKASYEMLDSAWAKQVGKRAEELSYMMREGVYSVKFFG